MRNQVMASRTPHHSRGTRARRAAFLGGLAGLMFTTVPPALGAEVQVQNSTLVLRAPGEQRNTIDVTPLGLAYEVYDDAGALIAGPGCVSLSDRLSVCGGMVLRIDVDAGPGGDLVGLWDVKVPVTMAGGAGDDLLEGGAGLSDVQGGAGVDTLVGGGEDDQLSGGDGDDLVRGQGGADLLLGGQDADILEGGVGSGDVLEGGADDDLLRGGEGADELLGDSGDDSLVGGKGEDTIIPGSGSDEVFATDGSVDDVKCGSTDRVRGDAGERESSCARIEAGKKSPRTWPPRQQASTAILPPDPGVRVRLRHRGNATRIAVKVVANHTELVRPAFSLYNKQRKRIKHFKRAVRAKHWRSFKKPAPRHAAWYVRARCCG